MKGNKFKDKDILVSDSNNIISILKGDYNNGEFRKKGVNYDIRIH